MTSTTTKQPIIAKTQKLFIHGEFPRSESGRTAALYASDGKTIHSHVCLSSKKDLKAAVGSCLQGASEWSKKTAYNRGQIIYRFAEMLLGRRRDLQASLMELYGLTDEQALLQINQSIELLIYYAGFTDKITQVAGSLNPVSGPFHNFSTLEPIGALSVVSGSELNLVDLIHPMAAALASGNSVVMILTGQSRGLLSDLGEILKTSDFPAGVVNLLSGQVSDLLETLSTHMELPAVVFSQLSKEQETQLRIGGVNNMKRLIHWNWSEQGIQPLIQMSEIKTVWHPVGV